MALLSLRARRYSQRTTSQVERENGDSGNDPQPGWRQMADVSNGVSNGPKIPDG
jgi:hypothetical protein